METTDPFACPRCGVEVEERYYGPCATCRTSLRDSHGGEQRQVEAGRFEPAMHVTPNAVATKD